jgi:phosphate acetyltransferase
MAIIDNIKAKAKADIKHIVLPEGEEIRNVQAAVMIRDQGLAKLTLLGNPAKVKEVAAGADLTGIDIIDPTDSDKAPLYAATLYDLRKAKGMTEEEAAKKVADPMYYGIMMVKLGDADGLVSGAIHSTGDMLRPALQVIKSKPGMKTVSSCFLMECPDKSFGDNGVMIFSDCGVNIDPDAEQLANIALGAADSARSLAGMEPRVAMLSFSTKGSAKHDNVTKVQEATRIAKEMAPDLMLDGELQLDAALVEKVGQLKAPGSKVAGHANTLVFPDLDAGNIGYKLVQRLGGADAYGPMLQGIAQPVNDLSRGCSWQDIVGVVALTAVQAQDVQKAK